MVGRTIVEVRSLTKRFGTLTAINDIHLEIKEGEIFGLLGPNGSGKTTIINVLLSLIPPTAGTIFVQGLDVRKRRNQIKPLIGLMAQETIVEADLTARENLVLFSKLYDIPANQIDEKVKQSLEDAGLTEFAEAKAGTFSGGMKRRLGLVRALIQQPKILVLDEPTTGLDVQNRARMWEKIKALNNAGTTVILTTQYLEEADELCDRIAIIDRGRVIISGTPNRIKSIVKNEDILELVVKPQDVQKVVKLLRTKFGLNAIADGEKVSAVLNKKDKRQFTNISRALDQENLSVLSRSVHLPTLDDVFIKLTGSKTRDKLGQMKGGIASVRWK